MVKEYEALKEALKGPATPEAMKAAGQAAEKYIKAQPLGSKPMLVTLAYGRTYPTAIPLEEIPKQIATNPEFYELMKKVIRKE